MDDRKLITEQPGIVPQAENQLLIHVACWLKRLLQKWQKGTTYPTQIFKHVSTSSVTKAKGIPRTVHGQRLRTFQGTQPKSPRGEPKEAVCSTCNSTRKQLSNQFG